MPGQRNSEVLGFAQDDSAFLFRAAPLIHPIVHRLVPKPAVLRLKHPMAFVREIQHFRRHLQHLQRSEKIERLRNIEPEQRLSIAHHNVDSVIEYFGRGGDNNLENKQAGRFSGGLRRHDLLW